MAIIQEQDYLAQLHLIQNHNPPSQVIFPELKKIYNVDLDSRVVEAPQILSIAKDHESETIYFRIDRYHDFMDLSLLAGVIQFVTPDNQTHWYPIPFYDVVTEKKNNKMIVPWCIRGDATKLAGNVTFSLKFFLVEITEKKQSDEIDDESLTENIPSELVYNLIYSLTTLPATSMVLDTMEIESMQQEYNLPVNDVMALWYAIKDVQKYEGVNWEVYE